jgi:hypothetical protein
MSTCVRRQPRGCRQLGRRICRVVATFCVVAISPLVASAQEAPQKNGDVNGDGNVSAVDALAVLNTVVGLPAVAGNTPARGDADCDGAVTSVDAQIILAFTVNQDVARFCVNTVVTAVTASVGIESGTGQVLTGGVLVLSAVPRDSTSLALPGKVVTWTSSDVAKATVSADGRVTGVSQGDVTISAMVDGREGVAIISVLPRSSVVTLQVSPRSGVLLTDSLLPLVATVKDAAGNVVGGSVMTFVTETNGIVSVTPAGSVRGLMPGTARVIVSSGTLRDTALIVVTSGSAVATRTWTGATSTDLGVATNWNPQVVPAVTDTVFVPAPPANQPALRAGITTIAGISVQRGATVSLGDHELQVTGRVDADGTISATGPGVLTISGVATRESFVRGTLPRLRVIGSTTIVGQTSVVGGVEVLPNSILDLNTHAVRVSESINVRGGLRMRSSTADLSVRGGARFFSDAASTSTVLTDGLLRIGGSVTFVSALTTNASPFAASGSHRTVLDGTAAQMVRDSGVAVVDFQQLTLQNPSGGVSFENTAGTRYRIRGSLTALDRTTVTGGGRVNVLGAFAGLGGTVTVRNLSVARGVTSLGTLSPDTLTLIGSQPLPGGAAYRYRSVVIGSQVTMQSHTDISGTLILGCVTLLSECTTAATARLVVAGQKLAVSGDLRQGALGVGSLLMQAASDSVVVRGAIRGQIGAVTTTTEFLVAQGDWSAGVLRVAGDFRGRGAGASGSHLTILDGTAQQTVRAAGGFGLQSVIIANGAGVAVQDTSVLDPQTNRPTRPNRVIPVRGDFTIATSVAVTGANRVEVAGNVQTAVGSSVGLGAISIGSTLQAAGTFTPDTVEFFNPGTAQTIQNLPTYNSIVVRGKAAFGGNITVRGGLTVLPTGELNLAGRRVTVNRSLVVAGILRMQDVRDTLIVLGDSAAFLPRADPLVRNYATAGLLKVSGSLLADSTGFYPSGSHRTLYDVGPILFNENRRLSGAFQHLDLVGTLADTLLNQQVGILVGRATVRGNLTASAGTAPIFLHRTRVDGDAILTQRAPVQFDDSSFVAGTTTAFWLRAFVGSSAKVNNLRMVSGARAIVGNSDLQNVFRYSGTYSEDGPLDYSNGGGDPALFGVRTVRFVQQPTNTRVSVPFSPAVTVEVVDATGGRVRGVQVVYVKAVIENPSNAAAPFGSGVAGIARIFTADGVGTFTGLAPTGVVRFLTIGRGRVPREVQSATFTVSP